MLFVRQHISTWNEDQTSKKSDRIERSGSTTVDMPCLHVKRFTQFLLQPDTFSNFCLSIFSSKARIGGIRKCSKSSEKRSLPVNDVKDIWLA